MKTIFSISLISLISTVSLLAQTKSYYDSAAAKGPGYWELSTDYRTNGTAIRYFDANKRLLHQEVLPNQLVKLTEKNVRRLNETLNKVTQSQPVPSNVQSVALPEDTEDSRTARKRKKMLEAERRASTTGLVARVVASTNGDEPSLKVFLYNPHETRFRIDVLNSRNYIVAQAYDNSYQKYYKFNMREMPVGDYRINIYELPQKKPTVSNLVSLSRKPSETFFSMKTDTSTSNNNEPFISKKD